jgi:oligopeptide/dipeptide ABC transporter ATP-binding protein
MTEPVIGTDATAAASAAASEAAITAAAAVRSAAASRGPLAMQATGLSKDYKLGAGAILHAVRNVSFGLYRGAVVALVGESGSGKSTAAKLLAGQERLTAGAITLDGQPVDIRSIHAFRRYKSQVQYVFQDPFASLNPVHTVAYHLARPVRLHQGDVKDVNAAVIALLEQVRLTPARQFAAKYPHELSGGQRQRVSFARALAARPTVLLADEPVSMLDVSIRLEMLNLLDDLRTQLSLAMLYITHDIASARYFADEVLVMYGGQIVERGPAEEVTQHPAHPYTQLLIASAPDPDNLGSVLKSANIGAARKDARTAAAGPATTGCPFSNRCPLVVDKCRQDDPTLQLLTPERAAACWRLDVAASATGAARSNGPQSSSLSQHPRGRSKLTIQRITGKRAKRALALTAAGLLAAGLAACSSSGSSSSSTGSAKSSSSSGTSASSEVVMESSPENSITQDFNPFVSTGAPQGMGATGLIYEPLIQFDLANPTVSYPWLATKYAWSNGGKSITFTIRQGVKWNNGTPLTPADVAFTFNYVKAHSTGTQDINIGGLQITSVSASGDTVTINFPSPQYMKLEQIAGQAILPKSQWSSVSDPATYTDPNPIGTGPYVLGNFTPEGFTMVANKYYWQKVPVAKVYFPDYTSNTGALSALFAGQIDWTGNYIPDLQQDFVNKDPANHHYWEAAGSSNALWPNLNEWPTNQLAVRQAIDVAINRSVIGSEGESGLESALTNASGITLPTYQAWLAPSVANMTVPASGSAAQAASILEKAGYKKDGAGYFALNGKEVAVTIVDPSSYTDYAQDAALTAQELKAAGINATFDGITVNAWNADMASGNFQLAIHWSSGGITPYFLYDTWLDDTLISGGQGDFEHLKDPAIQADLQKLNGDQTVAQQTSDLGPIEQYVATSLPVIPTTTAADWFEYNSQHFTGWPTQQNPYDSGQPSGTNNGPGTGSDEVILLHLQPAS